MLCIDQNTYKRAAEPAPCPGKPKKTRPELPPYQAPALRPRGEAARASPHGRVGLDEEGEEMYVVERLLDERKGRKGRAEFLVRWQGYSEAESTWPL